MESVVDVLVGAAPTVFGVAVVVAVVGEVLWRWSHRRDIDHRSTMTSVVSGLTFMAAKTMVGKGLFIGLGLWLYSNHRLFTLDITNPAVWLAIFLIRDFVYYWVHRFEHRVRVLWASHLVHHSPETIGMATAVRVPWMEALYKPMFSLWLPLLGFNPLAAVLLDVLAAIVAQTQHTEAFEANSKSLIGKIFVTPSAHRVHHGYNAEYLDKNFGAVLIIWDRMFGTYEPEVAPVKFGVGATDAVHDVRGALVGGYPRLWRDLKTATGTRHALAIAFARPGVAVPVAPSRETTAARCIRDTSASGPMAWPRIGVEQIHAHRIRMLHHPLASAVLPSSSRPDRNRRRSTATN